MPVTVACKCGKKSTIPDEYVGKKGRCKACGEVMLLERPDESYRLVIDDAATVITSPASKPSSVSSPNLVSCPDCGRKVSRMAPSCPECGRPLQATVAAAQAVNNTTVVVNPAKGSSVLGIGGFVFAILALLVCWIPLVNILTIPLVAIGVLLGAAGLVVSLLLRKSGVAWPAIGIGLNIAAFLIAAQVSKHTAMAIEKAVNEVPKPRDVPKPVIAGNAKAKIEPATDQVVETLGDVKVRVARVELGKPSMKDLMGSASKAKEEFLLLTIEIASTNDAAKINYRTWGSSPFRFDSNFATLTDDLGNTYKRISFGASDKIDGRVDSGSVYPDKPIEDLLIFETPLAKAKTLTLEMPGANVGQTGAFRLKIDRDQIK